MTDLRLADAADLPALDAAGIDRRTLDHLARAMADPRMRVVTDGVDRLALLDARPDPDGVADVAIVLGDRDPLLEACAAHAADLGIAAVRDAGDHGTVVDAPPSAPDLASRFLRAAAVAANLAEVAAARTAGLGHEARKADGSISLAADAAADDAAAGVLAQLGIPMLSEERADIALPDPDAPWLVVDPIDGTGNYRAGLPPWAFAAGLVADGRPLAGYVADLSSGRRWWGAAGVGAVRDGRPATTRRGTTLLIPTPPAGGTAVVPVGYRRLRITGCTAIDLCLVADGSAGAWHDLDRDGTHVHDVAGALGVVVAAGGVCLTPDGEELRLAPDTETLIRFASAADHEAAAALVAAFR